MHTIQYICCRIRGLISVAHQAGRGAFVNDLYRLVVDIEGGVRTFSLPEIRATGHFDPASFCFWYFTPGCPAEAQLAF